MSTIRRKTQVREEQRTAETVAPPPLPPIPEVNYQDDILLILKERESNTISVKPAQGKDLWFYFETNRVLGKPEVIGFIRKNLRGDEND